MKFFDSSKRVGAGLGLGALLAMASSAVSALPVPWQLNMTKGVTKTSQDVYQIHMWAFYVCCVIGIIVFGAMIIAMFKFRKSKGAIPAKWSHNTKAEIVWTVVPILILVVLAAPATGVMINMAHTADSQMTVKITGYQWKWRYEYLNWGEKPYHVNFISKLDGDSEVQCALLHSSGPARLCRRHAHPRENPRYSAHDLVPSGDDSVRTGA